MLDTERPLDIERLAGQIIAGGFAGETAPEEFLDRLRRGHLGGAVLFKRNATSIEQVWELNRALFDACAGGEPPLLAVDHEGGRVHRLPPPVTHFPPMRRIGDIGRPGLAREIGSVMAVELRALGFNANFAPVCDVDSVPDSPVIGDRSFGGDPGAVALEAVELIEGLQQNQVLACAKHFPGHGGTRADSHRELPRLERSMAELRSIDLPPFWAAVGGGVAMVMTAHVAYDAIDRGTPATLSPAAIDGLLRGELGFDSVVVSDDLEMDAILKHQSAGEAAVAALRAGVDLLLICHRADRQEEAREAIVHAAQNDPRVRRRLERSVERVRRLRTMCPPRPVSNRASLESAIGAPSHRALAERLTHEKENSPSRSMATRTD